MKKYIYELSDWPQFSWSQSTVLPSLLKAVAMQSEMRGRVRTFGFTDRDALQEANIAMLTDSVVKTSAIEGENLDEQSVRSSVARHLGIDIGLELPENRNVEGIVEVLIDATQKREEPLTDSRIFAWHAALFPTGYNKLKKMTIGAWRPGSIDVVSGYIGKYNIHYTAPAATRVDAEMTTFIDWFNDPEEVSVSLLLKAAVAHLWFETLHPLDDGNGRIGRALADILLARSDNMEGRFYSLSSQIAKEKSSYYRALEESQKGTLDITDWIVWFLECLTRAIDSSENVLDQVEFRRRVWHQINQTEGLAVNDRHRKVLQKFLSGHWEGYLTADKWEAMTQTSRVTALRDIGDLIKVGVLVQEGGGRSIHYRVVTDDELVRLSQQGDSLKCYEE